MASFSVNQYLSQIYDYIQSCNGPKLSDLLSFRHPHVASPMLCNINDPTTAVERVIDPPWDELIISHLKCIGAVNNADFVEAYKYQTAVILCFTKLFQSHKEDNWALPILYCVCLDTRLFAQNADQQLSKKGIGKPSATLEKAADLLMGCFRVCASDNRSSQGDTKRIGMLYLVNQLFKIYFKINKLHLCKPLIRAIDSSTLKDSFTISQMVTYRYFVGRKSMFDNDFKSAEEFLMFAFQRCHKASHRNKRLILIYLIPVKMLLGDMPKKELLDKYDLLQFKNVVDAVTEGNLLRLNQALEDNEAFFIKCGIYLILEKLKIITYRNLFKKVYLILGVHQIPISAFLTALEMMKVADIDVDEVACIMANLICEGKVKGYISHQHQKVVISKQNPFPPLSSIN